MLVSSRDAADYGDLIARSGACGFIPKAELSGASTRAPPVSRPVRARAAAAAVAEVERGARARSADSSYEPHKTLVAALALTAGISFVAAGLIARRRRPDNRTGIYLASVGYLWFLGALSRTRTTTAYTAATRRSRTSAFIAFAALVLAFPTGRLAPRPDRLIVAPRPASSSSGRSC